MRYVSQPANTFTYRRVDGPGAAWSRCAKQKSLTTWCVQNGERLALAGHGLDCVEELLRRSHIAELGW